MIKRSLFVKAALAAVAASGSAAAFATTYQLDPTHTYPSFAVDHSCVTPCTHNPLGVKGCGEAGAIGSPPTLVNAVLDALNSGGFKVDHIDMPLSPSRVWTAMQAAR